MLYKTEPWKEQAAIVEHVLSHYNERPYWALTCEMGVGKTKMTIDIHSNLHAQGLIDAVLVFAPKTVYKQWPGELEKHSPVTYRYFVHKNPTTNKYEKERMAFFHNAQNTPTCLHWYFVNVEAMASPKLLPVLTQFMKRQRTAIVIDESTKIKDHKTRRWKGVSALSKLAVAKSILSGTSAAQGVVFLWAQYDILKPRYFNMSQTAFQSFTTILVNSKQCMSRIPIGDKVFHYIKSIYENKVKTRAESFDSMLMRMQYTFGLDKEDLLAIINSDRVTRYKNVDKVLEMIKPCTYNLKKSDCRDMPPKIYQNILLDLTKEQKDAIAQLAAYGTLQYQGESLTLMHKMQLGTRVLQILGGFIPVGDKLSGYELIPVTKNPKMEALLNEAEALGDSQAIIWAVYIAEVHTIAKTLRENEYSVAMICGEVTGDAREDELERFKNGEAQFLVMNPAVGAFGLNLDGVTYQYFYSRPFSVEQRLQAEDRTYRITSQSATVIKDLIFPGTWEDRVLAKLKDGKDLNAYMAGMNIKELFEVNNG